MRPYTEDAEHKITSYGPKTMLYNCSRYLLIQIFSLRFYRKRQPTYLKGKAFFFLHNFTPVHGKNMFSSQFFKL